MCRDRVQLEGEQGSGAVHFLGQALRQRVRIGVWVLIFLGLFTVIAWRLNAAYWKDVK